MNRLSCLTVLCLACCACHAPHQPENQEIANRSTRIVQGIGTNTVRLGMLEKTLTKQASPSVLAASEYNDNVNWLEYYTDGMSICCDTGKVDLIQFYFSSNEYKEFPGKTDKGIGAKSSIRDVICAYGQPESISNYIASSTYDWADARIVSLLYVDKGIIIDFANDRLHRIEICHKKDENDPFLTRDIGDTAKYRRIKCE